jgi:hypothetical protein
VKRGREVEEDHEGGIALRGGRGRGGKGDSGEWKGKNGVGHG